MPPPAPPETSTSWHLDKRVPIALIVTIMLQLGAWIWWTAGLARDVQEDRRRIELLERNDAAQASLLGRINEQLARVDERLAAIASRLPPPDLWQDRRGQTRP